MLREFVTIFVPLAFLFQNQKESKNCSQSVTYGWVFVVTIVIATIVAFLSILWQALKAARTNPAMELKKE